MNTKVVIPIIIVLLVGAIGWLVLTFPGAGPTQSPSPSPIESPTLTPVPMDTSSPSLSPTPPVSVRQTMGYYYNSTYGYSLKMSTGFVVNGYYADPFDNERFIQFSVDNNSGQRIAIFSVGVDTLPEWNTDVSPDKKEITRTDTYVYYYVMAKNEGGIGINQQARREVPEIIASFLLKGKTSAGCYIGGCSGQICSDKPGIASDCVFRPEYVCAQRYGRCERQHAGECGWTSSYQFTACYQSHGNY